MKVCAREGCGRSFRPWKKTQACCSRSCAKKHSPRLHAHLRKVARIGGKHGGALRRRAAIDRWNRQIAGMSKVEIAKAFYRKGYNNGRAANARVAYARGYDDASKHIEQSDPGAEYSRGYRHSIEDTIAAVLT